MTKLNLETIIGVAALLIHAAKIDEKYSEDEKFLVKEFIKSYTKEENSDDVFEKAENAEKNSNQLLNFTSAIKQNSNDIKSDIIELMLSSINENIKSYKNDWHKTSCATVVMSTKGYPGSYENGSIISNLSLIKNNEDFQIFHAATSNKDGKIIANGGRVLSITAKDKSLQLALNKIYGEIENIDWPEGYYRKDIGFKALK